MTLDFNIREYIKIYRITKGVKSTNNYEGRLLAIKAIDDFQKRKGFDWLTLTSKAGYQSEIGNYSECLFVSVLLLTMLNIIKLSRR